MSTSGVGSGFEYADECYEVVRDDEESAELTASKARAELRHHYTDAELAERVRVEGASVVLSIESWMWLELRAQLLAWRVGEIVFRG